MHQNNTSDNLSWGICLINSKSICLALASDWSNWLSLTFWAADIPVAGEAEAVSAEKGPRDLTVLMPSVLVVQLELKLPFLSFSATGALTDLMLAWSTSQTQVMSQSTLVCPILWQYPHTAILNQGNEVICRFGGVTPTCLVRIHPEICPIGRFMLIVGTLLINPPSCSCSLASVNTSAKVLYLNEITYR